MARQIIADDMAQTYYNGIARKIGLSDKEIYGTDFKDSWITKKVLSS